jgi:hypothetical protein
MRAANGKRQQTRFWFMNPAERENFVLLPRACLFLLPSFFGITSQELYGLLYPRKQDEELDRGRRAEIKKDQGRGREGRRKGR